MLHYCLFLMMKIIGSSRSLVEYMAGKIFWILDEAFGVCDHHRAVKDNF